MKFLLEDLERRDLLTAALVSDINQITAQSSNPRDFAQVGDTTYFVASSDLGDELWKTDGTDQGTSIVIDLVPGSDSSNPHTLIPLENRLLFHVGESVWSTDGTTEGTFLLDDVLPIAGANGSFAVDETRITDGTPEGTKLVEIESSDVRFRPGSSPFIAKEDAFYVVIRREVFEVNHDGIATPFRGVPRPSLIDTHDGVLIVAATDNGFGFHELAAEEPLVEIPVRLRTGLLDNPLSTIVTNDLTYFETSTGNNITVWRTDNTAEGTFAIATFEETDVFPTSPTAGVLDTAVVAGDSNSIWFVADDEQAGRELWKSDGTEAGTVRVADIALGSLSSNPFSLHAQGTRVWFIADGDGESGSVAQRQIWTSDGTSEGTRAVTDFAGPTNDTEPALLAVNDDTVFFRGRSDNGIELWKHQADEVRQVKDILPGSRSSLPSNFFESHDGTYFFSATGISGTELWRTDGTEEGTVLVSDIHRGTRTGSAAPNNFATFDDKMYFAANDGLKGSELWSYDGSSVQMVAELNPGELGSFPKNLTSTDDGLYFTADDGSDNRALWRLNADGTTIKIEGTDGTNPNDLAVADGTLFFLGNTSTDVVNASVPTEFRYQRGLWSVSGDVAQIEFETKDAVNRDGPGTVDQLTTFNDQLYFFEFDEPGNIAARINRFTPGADPSLESLAESRTFRGTPGMWSTPDRLLIAGPNEDVPSNGGFWTVDQSGELTSLDVRVRPLDSRFLFPTQPIPFASMTHRGVATS